MALSPSALRALARLCAAALAAAVMAIAATSAMAAREPVTTRIVGGGAAGIGSWPSIAAIVDASAPDAFSGQFCGGTVIAPRKVLTAAHCVVHPSLGVYPPSAIDVVTGQRVLSGSDGQRLDVEEISVHPAYSVLTDEWDAAVLHLAAPTIAPAMYMAQPADSAVFAAGVTASAAGWGATFSGQASGFPDELRTVDLPLQSAAYCGSVVPGFTSAAMICAGNPLGGVDTCQGDSGGPLAVNPVGTWVLVGITSFGQGCADPDQPGVYTKVAAISAWAAGVTPAPAPPPPTSQDPTPPVTPVAPPPLEPVTPAPLPPVSPPAPVDTVQPRRPALIAAPWVSGTPRAGKRVTCVPGQWQHKPTAFRYTWTVGGRLVTAFRAKTVTLRKADRGKQLRCRVSAVNAAGAAVAVSPAVRVR